VHSEAQAATAAPRLASVDALRGLCVAAMLLVNNPGDWAHVYPSLLHAPWQGCTLADLVFPFFLFVCGASLTLGLQAGPGPGQPPAQALRALLLRAARLFALGVVLHVVAWLCMPWPEFRLLGVLQRIALCVGLCGCAALWLSVRQQLALGATLTLAWAALLGWGGQAPQDNLADTLDAWALGSWAYRFDPLSGQGHDPEGLLSTLGALATTLGGCLAGRVLLAGRPARLMGAAWAAAACGLALHLSGVMPFNKALWSPSYLLWTGGWAAGLLGALHVQIDKHGWPAFGQSLGRQALFIYVLAWLATVALHGSGVQAPLYRLVFQDNLQGLDPRLPSLAFALAFTAVFMGLARFMAGRGWVVKL
jgi:predicted acyltransferase